MKLFFLYKRVNERIDTCSGKKIRPPVPSTLPTQQGLQRVANCRRREGKLRDVAVREMSRRNVSILSLPWGILSGINLK
jgi:hypothetical protein